MKVIEITVVLYVPSCATDKDIKDFVDVQYGECNSMKMDNPCLGDATEVIEAKWEYTHE